MSDHINELDSIAEEEVQSVKSEPQIKVFISQEKLRDDLSFSPNSIDEAMMQQASLFAHYATQAAKAQLQADRRKSQLELVEALIDKELREEAADEGRKITEAQIEKAIRLDARYRSAQNSLAEAKMVASMVKSASEAFMQRRDMLVQIGKDMREERRGELTIRSANQQVEDLKGSALTAIQKARQSASV